jgi:hypothetical protein
MVADDDRETVLTGGSVNRVVRVGDTVRRPTGHWTPPVHALLRHLEHVGFAGAPRVLGIDERGREILTFLDGDVATRPWPAVMRTDDGLVQSARLLHRYHEAVASFVPPVDARWRSGPAAMQAGQVISHGDLGPWNSIWSDNELVGLIDWEFAEPRWPVEDVAELAWYFVPLQGPRVWRDAGFEAVPDFARRVAVVCDAYGTFTVAEVVDALVRMQQLERQRTLEFGVRGISPWNRFLARGDVAQFDEEHAWLRRHHHELVADLGHPDGRASSK